MDGAAMAAEASASVAINATNSMSNFFTADTPLEVECLTRSSVRPPLPQTRGRVSPSGVRLGPARSGLSHLGVVADHQGPQRGVLPHRAEHPDVALGPPSHGHANFSVASHKR